MGLLKPDVEQMRARGNVAGLIKALQNKDYDMRKGAAAALLSLCPAAVPALLAAVSDENENARILSSWVLAEVSRNPAELSASIKASMIPPLIQALTDHEPAVRCNAAFSLGEISDSRAIAPLSGCLSDPDSAVRRHASAGIGKLCLRTNDPSLRASAVKLLIPCVKDGDIHVRQAIITSLGLLGDPGSVTVLITAARDRSPDVRNRAIEALARLGKPVIPAIVAAMNDKDPMLRGALEEALVKIAGKPAAEVLAGLLTDRRSSVRCAAAMAIGRNGEAGATGSLVTALRAGDADLRLAAAEALDILNWKPDSMERQIDFSIGRRQWDECVEAGASAVRPLLRLLPDEDREVAAAAEEALVKIGFPATLPATELLQAENLQVREAAARILNRIGQAPAAPEVAAPSGDSKPDGLFREPVRADEVSGDSNSDHMPRLHPVQAASSHTEAALPAARPVPAAGSTTGTIKAGVASMIAGLGLRPLGNKKRLGFVEGMECNAFMVLFKSRGDAEHYYEVFVRYALELPPPSVTEIMLAHVPKIAFSEKHAFVLPYFKAGARLGYNLWAREAIDACSASVQPQNHTAGRYELLPGITGPVIRWDILLPKGFEAGSREAQEMLCDPQGMGYGTAEIAGTGKAVPGKPCPRGPWIGVLYDLSRLGVASDPGEAAASALLGIAGAGKLAGCIVHGGVFQNKYWCSAIHTSGDGQAEQLELAVLESTLASKETLLATDAHPVIRDASTELQALPLVGFITESGEFVGKGD